MKTKNIIGVLALSLIISFGLICCEEIEGDGMTNDTGTVLRVNYLTDFPLTVDVVFYEVDSLGEVEDPPSDSQISVQFEIDSILQGDYESDQVQNGINIDYYDITYQCVEPYDNGCATITPQTNVGLGSYIWPGKKLDVEGILLMSLARKAEFITNLGDPYAYPLYKVTLTFHGTNQFNEPIEASSTTQVILGSYFVKSEA